MERIIHPIRPVYNENSEILILGSFPSVKSREQGFFYGHPQNRFWKVIASVVKDNVPSSIEEKRRFLIRNKIAVWDVIESCDIEGSSDSSINNVIPNDLAPLLENSSVKRIYCNGAKAYELYSKYIEPVLGIVAIKLPSTSPANAAWSLDKLIEEWRCAISEHI